MKHFQRLGLALAAALPLALAAPELRAEASDAFRPAQAQTVTLSASTSSASAAVVVSGQLRIANKGTVWAYVKIGTGSITASTSADMPIAPGSVEVISGVGDHIAAITDSGTADLRLTPGVGL